MNGLDVVELSRLQFALTALYHFLFVPLTLGLSVLLAIMESVYVMTGRRIWRDITMFWGILFGINFAMGVATGITMEFQFGTNWSYYSQYVGDVFGAPLAIEGLMAFFLEATFIGLFFFGWDRLSKPGHLAVTWCVAFGSNFSALWILIANAWMQHPVGSHFNPDTMRMEVTDFFAVIFNTVAQIEIRAHGERRIRDRSDVRALDQRVLSAARTPRRACPAVDDGCRLLRARVGALGRRARRRERVHDDAKPEDQDSGDGSGMAHRAGAGAAHGLRHPRRGPSRDARYHPDSLAARADSDAQHLDASAGNRESRRRGEGAHPPGHRCLLGGAAAAHQPAGRRRTQADRAGSGRSRLCHAAAALRRRREQGNRCADRGGRLGHGA